MKKIPVCEPLLDGNELVYVTEAVRSGWISSSGTYVKSFEEAFAAYCGVRHGITVCNGTVALHLLMRAADIGPGDEVIIPDFTMIASALAVCYTGALPVFVDAAADTWNMNADAIEACITPRTKAIMAVHIFGQPCAMDRIASVAERHNLMVVEDAAEAHGAVFQGKKAGALSRMAAFSFFANKNLTTGEGGMVVTDDDALAESCRYFRNMCFPLNAPRTYLHEDMGFNYRMSNLHAAIGLAQTERADHYVSLRRRNGLLYREYLRQIPGVLLQADQAQGQGAFWMNGLCLTPEYGRTRQELLTHLAEHGVDTRLFFQGMHRQPALCRYGCHHEGNFPVSDMLADNGFYLPSGSTLKEEDILYITTLIRNYARS